MYIQIHNRYTWAASLTCISILCMRVCSLQSTLHINMTIHILCEDMLYADNAPGTEFFYIYIFFCEP